MGKFQIRVTPDFPCKSATIANIAVQVFFSSRKVEVVKLHLHAIIESKDSFKEAFHQKGKVRGVSRGTTACLLSDLFSRLQKIAWINNPLWMHTIIRIELHQQSLLLIQK